MQGMSEGADLPSSEMSGQENHSFAQRLGLGKVLKAIVNSDFGDVLWPIARKKAELRQLPAKAFVELTQDLPFFLPALLGKSDVQVAQAHAPQARMESISRKSDRDAQSSRQGPWEPANQFCQQPDRKIFNTMPHRFQLQP